MRNTPNRAPTRALIRATVLVASLVAVAACSGSSNSPDVNPGPGAPPVVDNSFVTFVKSLLATTAADTAASINVNARELTFDENPNAYNDVLGN